MSRWDFSAWSMLAFMPAHSPQHRNDERNRSQLKNTVGTGRRSMPVLSAKVMKSPFQYVE